ncbi:unnamed protein product [Brassica oleracea var. botrytis]|uniref:(rape) hypothetical protein n=1 Tax=Brassica napus TaxID=3708 RepID=A0A816S9W5_BRANA|nr:unnamed protein product [Brassica napus]
MMIYREGMTNTMISGNLSKFEYPKSTTAAITTFCKYLSFLYNHSISLLMFCGLCFGEAVLGDNFIARDIKFVNTAGPEKYQVIAFHSKSNHTVLFRCVFYGYTDTLYAHIREQFYRKCDIVGMVDLSSERMV